VVGEAFGGGDIFCFKKHKAKFPVLANVIAGLFKMTIKNNRK